MACPLCGEDCRCVPVPGGAESDAHVSVLIDPDQYDSSEENFSASLRTEAANTSASEEPDTTPITAEFTPEALLAAATQELKAAPPAPDFGAMGGVGAAQAAGSSQDAPRWRQEVAARLDNFRNRRRRRSRNNSSLSLDFEPSAGQDLGSSPPLEAPKVIAFPRPSISTRPEVARVALETQSVPPLEELAEPILDSPRILEAEEVEEEDALHP
ncbi:MAG: hypothetical protein ACRD2R_09035, partial [Terriglobales bacterium]